MQHAAAPELGIEYGARYMLAWNYVNVAASQPALRVLQAIVDSTSDAVEM